MKKIFLVLLFSVYSLFGYADIISYTQFDSSTTIGELNTALNRIYIDHNGNVTSSNIASRTIQSDDMANAVNPIIRDNELIGDYVVSGLLPATASGLTSNISAGVAYITGYRIEKSVTAHTYTASKDTYVYLGTQGDYKYSIVANGASQPATDSDYILLAKVVTDGTDITSVTDHRQVTPQNLRIYQDYKQGLRLSRDVANVAKVEIGRGEIEFGNTSGKVRRSSVSGFVDFSTTGRNALNTGSLAAETYYYIIAISDDGGTTGLDFVGATSSSDTVTVGGESITGRLIGWCYSQSASTISPDSVGAYRGRGGDAPNITIVDRKAINTSYASGVHKKIHPSIRVYTSGRPVEVTCHISGDQTSSTGEVNAYVIVSADGVKLGEGTYRTNDAGVFTFSDIYTTRDLGEGTHYIDVAIIPASTLVIESYNIAVEEK